LATGEVSYYLPAGRWTHLLSGEVSDGPGWRQERHDALSLPLWVRPGSLLITGATDDRPDYAYASGPTVALYALDDGATATATLPTPGGEVAATFIARRQGDSLTVEWEGQASQWRLLLAGMNDLADAGGCQAEVTPRGLLLTPPAGLSRVRVRLGVPGSKI
jgi:alpha-D-xyloside xylohydrolase